MTLSACILLSSPCHIWTVIRKNHLEFPQHSNQAQRGHTCNSAYLEPFDHLNENDHLFKVAKLMALVFIWSTDHAELWVTPQISLKQQERCLAGPWEPELSLTCPSPLEAWLDPRYWTMKLSPVKICDNHHTQGTEGQRLLCFRTSGPHTPTQSWAGFISVLPVWCIHLCTFEMKTFNTCTIFVMPSVWLCVCFKTNKNRIKHNLEIILSFVIRSRGLDSGLHCKISWETCGEKTQQQNSPDPAREIPPWVD